MTAQSVRDVQIHELVSEDGLLTHRVEAPRQGRARVQACAPALRRISSSRKRRRSKRRSATPCPKGSIIRVGTFGPWNGEEPSLTPIAGTSASTRISARIDGIGGTAARRRIVQRAARPDRDRGRHQDRGLSPVHRRHDVSAAREVHRRLSTAPPATPFSNRSKAISGARTSAAKGAIVKVEGVKGRRITLDTQTRGRHRGLHQAHDAREDLADRRRRRRQREARHPTGQG